MAVVEQLECVRVSALDELHHLLVREIADVFRHGGLFLRGAGPFGSGPNHGKDSPWTNALRTGFRAGHRLTLVAAGIAGFFYNASFATGDDVPRDAVIGILDVNGWHNVVHIATGVAGLVLAGSYDGARLFGGGALYLVVAVAASSQATAASSSG